MKRIVLLMIAIVLLAVIVVAQQPATGSSNQGTAQGQTQQGAGAPAQPAAGAQAGTGSQAGTGAAATQPAAPPQTPGTYFPQPKTAEETEAVKAAFALTDPAQIEKAGDDLATKFPDSEFRGILYERAMEMYREQNNADKAVELGRKALAANPDSVTALSGLASILSEKTRETDLDKEERWAEAAKAANHLLQLGDNMKIPANPGTPVEQVNGFRDQAKGMALIALGTIEMNKKNDKAAADYFKQAIAADKNLKDPVVYLRQSVVLDRMKQYPQALESANKVVELGQPGSRVAELGKQQQQRLQKLMAGGATPAAGAAAPTSPSTQPSTSPSTTPSTQPSTQASDPQR